MPELIDKSEVLKRLCAACYNMVSFACISCVIPRIIKETPTAKPEVRHGHWENIPGMNNTVFCSECLAAANKELAMRYKGCPFCLARMDGGDDK